ncbi:DUF1700 domain-containing protein [Paenibacillus sp. GCM10023252]|uniref:DUF1700 domain-containing protein n=1 Tax=Paenibacillus sp. GCM10023252 TaxID=3252649 RepID=UPI003622165B
MITSQFLQELNNHLSKLSSEERADVLSDYEEHIFSAMEQGKSEAEAILALGHPKVIAKAILAEQYVDQATTARNPYMLGRAVFATVSLGFFNIVVVLAPLASLLAGLIALYAIAAALILSPLLGVFMLSTGFDWSILYAMMLALGAGILVFIGLWSLTKLIKRWLIQYLKYNIRLARGGQHR